jgi:hypothetical protein
VLSVGGEIEGIKFAGSAGELYFDALARSKGLMSIAVQRANGTGIDRVRHPSQRENPTLQACNTRTNSAVRNNNCGSWANRGIEALTTSHSSPGTASRPATDDIGAAPILSAEDDVEFAAAVLGEHPLLDARMIPQASFIPMGAGADPFTTQDDSWAEINRAWAREQALLQSTWEQESLGSKYCVS